jgi:hypothetical protein
MIYKIQVVTIGEDGCQEMLEIACLERTDLKPETLGLTLAEGKMILNDLQQIVVERQVSKSLLLKQACPDVLIAMTQPLARKTVGNFWLGRQSRPLPTKAALEDV